MTEGEHMLAELEEKIAKLHSARAAARAADAGERAASDCKIVEQEYIGLCRRARDCIEKSGTAHDKERLARLEASGEIGI